MTHCAHEVSCRSIDEGLILDRKRTRGGKERGRAGVRVREEKEGERERQKE